MNEVKYPLRILSLGAGVQSTTVLLMMIHGEIEKADHVIFSDTGWESAAVYEHLNFLESKMIENNIPFHRVSNGNIRDDFLSQDKRYISMPIFVKSEKGKRGIIRRQCTNEYKLKPLRIKQRELAGLKKYERCKEHRITTIIGISWDEIQRVRDAEFSWVKNEYPLIDLKMTRNDCIKWCEDNGYQRPPRSACIGCPFRKKEEWMIIRNNKQEWSDAVNFDKSLRELEFVRNRYRGIPFLHSDLVPLDEVNFNLEQEQLNLFDSECQGMCGL